MKLTYEYRIAGTTTWQPINQKDIISNALKIKYETGDGSHFKLNSSGDITIRGAFYEYIRQTIWLPNNGQTVGIEMRIYVVKCEKYLPILVIDSGGLKYCDGDCHFTVSLKYKDDAFKEVKQSLPFSGIPVPINFAYCEDRSTIGFWVFMIITTILFPIFFLLALVTGSVFVDWFRDVRGCSYKMYGFRIQEHLRRIGTIIGLTYDNTTDDIFIPKYPNHCIVYYGKSDKNNYNLSLPLTHNPNWNGYELLEFLKKSYNIKYRLSSGLLRIKNKFDRWNATTVDLTDEKFCYDFKELDNPSLINFKHADDQMDTTGANAINYDDLVNVNVPTFTPAQSGVRDILFDFARQRFRLDGVKEDKLTKIDAVPQFAAVILALDAITPLNLTEDREYALNDSNNGIGKVRIIDWDAANSTEANAKVVRQPFNATNNNYYTFNLGLAGEDPTFVPIYGTVNNSICNASVFTNEFLNTNAAPNRIREFQDEYPQSAYQLERQNKRATATLNSCDCATLTSFGIFDGDEPIIDFWAATPSGEGNIVELEIDLHNGTAKIVIEI